MRKLSLLFPAFCLLLVGNTANAASPGKACDLVSKATAEKLFGGGLKIVTDIPMSNDGSASGCLYQNNEREQVNFHFQIRPEIPDTMADTVLKTLLHKGYPNDVVEKIAGVGQDNFFITSVGTPNTNTFTVLYHKSYLSIIVRGSRDKDEKNDIIQVMKQVLAKF